MINTINKIINEKMNSQSITNLIKGEVIDLEPLKIKLNNELIIGLDFIEPSSLGNDYSPGSTLPFVMGEVVDMIRYNNGQRFYVLNKGTSHGGFGNLDGGFPSANYGGYDPINGGDVYGS